MNDNKPLESENHEITLANMALSFLKIGAIGFGGGVAVISLLENECVQKKGCLEAEEFLHGVGLGQILGPFAVNTAIFIGYRMFGIVGALVAQIAFLLPSIALVIILSWLYFSYHQIPSLQGALAGLGPVVIALIVNASWSMGRKAIRSKVTLGLCLAAMVASLTKINPVWILSLAGIVGLILKLNRTSPPPAIQNKLLLLFPFGWQLLPHVLTTIPVVTEVSLGVLFWVFFQVGLVFFGGGFVLIPILSENLVNNLGWLTHQQFLDGVAISQLTPGPIAVIATFAGYKVGGIAGALVATIGLFVPATILMLFISHFYQRLSKIKEVKDFLAGINPAVVGLIMAAAIALTPQTFSLSQPIGIIVAFVALFLLAYGKWHPAFVLAIGAIIGILSSSFIL